MTQHNLDLGNLGETIAKKYLEDKGYSILEQNYENKYGEIDLIAKDKNILVFVEVKTRIKEQFGLPEDAINKNKIQRIARNAQAYLLRKGLSDREYRIDAICVVLDEKSQVKRVDHYENITS